MFWINRVRIARCKEPRGGSDRTLTILLPNKLLAATPSDLRPICLTPALTRPWIISCCVKKEESSGRELQAGWPQATLGIRLGDQATAAHPAPTWP